MKDIVNKIFKITNFDEVPFNSLKIKNFPKFITTPIEFKNTYSTDISSLNLVKDELIFDYFPYNQNYELKSDLLPPRSFSDICNIHDYLITLNSQIEKKESCPYINYLSKLKFFGILKQRKDKSVYLEIENESLINFLTNNFLDSKIQKRTNFNINIISKNEYQKKEVMKISENDLNRRYEFTIKGLYSTHINDNELTDKIWFLDIESQDLEDFRYKYHLFPKINGYNFSIVLGSINFFKLRKAYPKMKINITFFAA